MKKIKVIKCEEKSFGKKTKKLIKKSFGNRIELKQITKDLVIIKCKKTTKKLAHWCTVKDGLGLIILN